VIFSVWFVDIFWPRPVVDFYGVEVGLAPIWRIFFWSFLILPAVNVAIAGVNLLRPHWTRQRASLRLLSNGLGGALFCWLLKAHILTGISAASIPAAKAVELTNLINLWMTKMLPWAIVSMVVILCFDGYRIVRLRGVRLNGGSFGPAVKDLSRPMVNGN
jgi:hypothetical protein